MPAFDTQMKYSGRADLFLPERPAALEHTHVTAPRLHYICDDLLRLATRLGSPFRQATGHPGPVYRSLQHDRPHAATLRDTNLLCSGVTDQRHHGVMRRVGRDLDFTPHVDRRRIQPDGNTCNAR